MGEHESTATLSSDLAGLSGAEIIAPCLETDSGDGCTGIEPPRHMATTMSVCFALTKGSGSSKIFTAASIRLSEALGGEDMACADVLSGCRITLWASDQSGDARA